MLLGKLSIWAKIEQLIRPSYHTGYWLGLYFALLNGFFYYFDLLTTVHQMSHK